MKYEFLLNFLPLTNEDKIDNLISFLSCHKGYWHKEMDGHLKTQIPSRLYNYYWNQTSMRLGRDWIRTQKSKKSFVPVSALKRLVKNNRDYSKPALGDQVKKAGVKIKRTWLTFISVPMGGSNKKH